MFSAPTVTNGCATPVGTAIAAMNRPKNVSRAQQAAERLLRAR